jgi:hypothetical protein
LQLPRRFLKRALFNLIHRFHFGLTTENSFFLFVHESAVALVHIIAIEDTRLFFQVRGAKFRQSMTAGVIDASAWNPLVTLPLKGRRDWRRFSNTHPFRAIPNPELRVTAASPSEKPSQEIQTPSTSAHQAKRAFEHMHSEGQRNSAIEM